jgi:hypothetical protein
LQCALWHSLVETTHWHSLFFFGAVLSTTHSKDVRFPWVILYQLFVSYSMYLRLPSIAGQCLFVLNWNIQSSIQKLKKCAECPHKYETVGNAVVCQLLQNITQDVHCSWWHKCTDVFPSPGEQHEFYVMCCGLAACRDNSLLKVLDCSAYFERASSVKVKVCKIRGIFLAIHWSLPSTSVFVQQLSNWMAIMIRHVILLKLFKCFLCSLRLLSDILWAVCKHCSDCHITRYVSWEPTHTHTHTHTVVPPYSGVVGSMRYLGYLKPRIIPNAIYNVIFL